MKQKIIDVHCHILPGIDDGSGSREETLKMLSLAEKEGITDIIVTPHFKGGRRNASVATIRSLMEETRGIAAENGISIALHPGNEVYFFSDIEEVLEQERVLRMGYSEYLLVEFSPADRYTYIRNALDSIMGLGIRPVIAHVERYQCMLKDKEAVKLLKDMGVKIQVNASGITGEMGFAVKRFTHGLLKQGLVDYVGTDAHNCEKRAPRMKKCADLLCKKYGEEYAEALLYRNAQRDFSIPL